MSVAFRCRLPYNSDISKIRKFFEDADTMYVLAGKAGIAFEAITPDHSCMYLTKINGCDIYRLHTRHPRTLEDKSQDPEDPWKSGGIYRSFPAATLINFIKAREVNDDLQIEIDDEATTMTISIVSGANTIRSASISLAVPDTSYEFPHVTDANVVMRVNEFKKLCSDFARVGSEVKVESQDDAIRMVAGGNTVTHGNWVDSDDTHTCYIDKVPFNRATKINIGNTKNSLAGIYIKKEYPVMFKVKLGIVDFIICGKKSMNASI